VKLPSHTESQKNEVANAVGTAPGDRQDDKDLPRREEIWENLDINLQAFKTYLNNEENCQRCKALYSAYILKIDPVVKAVLQGKPNSEKDTLLKIWKWLDCADGTIQFLVEEMSSEKNNQIIEEGKKNAWDWTMSLK
jgi:hypothetical protein